MNALRKKDLLTLVACAVLFAVMQGLMMAEVIGPFWELNIVLICINIILSVSLNLINGYTGQFSIGHAGFWRLVLIPALSLRSSLVFHMSWH